MTWGPWFDCDGTGWPQGLEPFEGSLLEAEYDGFDGLCSKGLMGKDWPGLFWRWRRAGWFSRSRVRVCADTRFAPVVALRLWTPPALEQLRALAAEPERGVIDAPERVRRDA